MLTEPLTVEVTAAQAKIDAEKAAAKVHPSKFSGKYHSAVGSMKQMAGSATGNTELEAKGALEHSKGAVEVTAAQAKIDAEKAAAKVHPSKLSGKYHSAVGTMNQMAGSATGSTELEAKGASEHTIGDFEVSAAQAKIDAKKAVAWAREK
jgi:uncharacterized protein YjbJ (UPF0337 family)